jgi:chaperonin GroES
LALDAPASTGFAEGLLATEPEGHDGDVLAPPHVSAQGFRGVHVLVAFSAPSGKARVLITTKRKLAILRNFWSRFPRSSSALIEEAYQPLQRKGGIIIPDTAKEKPIEGEVIAVGNGKVLDDGTVRKLEVKAGDRVLFGKYSGTEVKIDGEEHLILREDDILGVIEK